MHFLELLSLLSLLIVMSLWIESSQAQNSAQDYVNVHNLARSQVGVGNIVWNTTLAAYAQTYANVRKVDCEMVHSNGPYGENIAKGTQVGVGFTGRAAVSLWVAEKLHYIHSINACVEGECLHYTQVVWHSSYRVGCARVRCDNSVWWFVTCNYDPPGNWMGERPY